MAQTVRAMVRDARAFRDWGSARPVEFRERIGEAGERGIAARVESAQRTRGTSASSVALGGARWLRLRSTQTSSASSAPSCSRTPRRWPPRSARSDHEAKRQRYSEAIGAAVGAVAQLDAAFLGGGLGGAAKRPSTPIGSNSASIGSTVPMPGGGRA